MTLLFLICESCKFWHPPPRFGAHIPFSPAVRIKRESSIPLVLLLPHGFQWDILSEKALFFFGGEYKEPPQHTSMIL